MVDLYIKREKQIFSRSKKEEWSYSFASYPLRIKIRIDSFNWQQFYGTSSTPFVTFTSFPSSPRLQVQTFPQCDKFPPTIYYLHLSKTVIQTSYDLPRDLPCHARVTRGLNVIPPTEAGFKFNNFGMLLMLHNSRNCTSIIELFIENYYFNFSNTTLIIN